MSEQANAYGYAWKDWLAKELECCDLYLTAAKFMMALVTTMVPVTTSAPSGLVCCFTLV